MVGSRDAPSAPVAAAMASSKPLSSFDQRLQPSAYLRVIPVSLAIELKPSRGDLENCGTASQG